MVTYERVRELFDYRDDGKLIWKANKGIAKKGDVAGTINEYGYSMIGIDHKIYRAHRLIWLWHKGYMPEYGLDHRNRIRHNNWIKNLREATQQCNLRNTGNRIDSTSGVKGVSKHKKSDKWQAHIAVDMKQCYLGNFDDFDEAVLTRLAAEQCLGWDGCDSASPAYRYALRSGLIHRRR